MMIELSGPRQREKTNENLSLEVYQDGCYGGYGLYISGCTGKGKCVVVKPFVLKECGIYHLSTPAISINETEAQMLLDSLWRAGIRPKDGSLSTGKELALTNHLNDMRKLVSHFTDATL